MGDADEILGVADETELFIALVAAVGTDIGMISDEVSIELLRVRLRGASATSQRVSRRGGR